MVETVREGRHGKGPVALSPGAVKQPNHVRCVRTHDYKLARYFDPSGKAPQEWEMYDLGNDPNEAVNLVEVAASPPRAREDLPERAEGAGGRRPAGGAARPAGTARPLTGRHDCDAGGLTA